MIHVSAGYVRGWVKKKKEGKKRKNEEGKKRKGKRYDSILYLIVSRQIDTGLRIYF